MTHTHKTTNSACFVTNRHILHLLSRRTGPKTQTSERKENMPGMLGFPSAKLLGSGLWGKPKNRLTTPLPHKKEPRFTKVSKHNSYIIKIHQRRFWAHHIPIPHHPKKKTPDMSNIWYVLFLAHSKIHILSSLKDTNIVAKPNLQENTQQVYVIL